VVKNPFDPTVEYAGISSASGMLRWVPDDVLAHRIVDQSPPGDPPRHLIIEFDGGAAALVAQSITGGSRYTSRTRKKLDKMAIALQREVLFVRLPSELMEQLRSRSNGGDLD
jgi:hypothetical protein